MSAVSTRNLHKSFGAVVALDRVNLDIHSGEFYGLLGPNGAGKTTLLRILCGLLAADSGEIAIEGHAAGGIGIGVVPQEIALYDVLTARQNLEVFGSLSGLKGRGLASRIHGVLDAVGLADRETHKVKTFSGGMKRRLNLAVGLLADPPILLLDEPTVGVDPQSRARIFSLLQELHAAGKTLIYTTHYMEEAERLCTRIGIIDHGRLLAEGTLSTLLSLVTAPRVVRVHGNLPDSLPQFDYLESVRQSGYTDYVPRNPDDLGGLVTRIHASGLPFERIEITGPDLEALFLQLTGKELRN
jgi:ABC-2 type transport system ATP-binding protein